ncbi:MAG TPA: hypothetical protein VFL29_12270 [Candidatus Dormibacteraeota bacterium]|nr:hypothetical protein [Candidatus Dormibacteraeota bacterium]
MGWDLDGRIGSVIIGGRERVGLAWVRDRARKRLVFYALPIQSAPNEGKDAAPQAEEFEIEEAAFRPVFSTTWARRRRAGRGLESD